MDGLHDLGGRQGFGRVLKEGKNDALHEPWEMAIAAIYPKLVNQKFFNYDEYRHAIERMAPRHYVSASYFERVFIATATLCVEKGVLSAEALNDRVGIPVPLASPSKPGRAASESLREFELGEKVRVKEDFVAGHTRCPAYIRGKKGVVVDKSPAYPFPDAAAHGLPAPKQRTFDVRFKSTDLWPDGAEDAEVHVGVFHQYLERCPD
jgi:nitrile hydratase